MSEANKTAVVAFYKQALMECDVENAFQLYAGPTYRQHNPLIEDGMDGVRKFVAWIVANHPDARGDIKRVFADGDHVILHSRGEEYENGHPFQELMRCMHKWRLRAPSPLPTICS
jgi:predicted SnoaL-like aldol condensation-catalyzing enzyme